jgi:transposase-like protein
MSAMRAVPFYCPYCGEQDIRPDDSGADAWRCASCERHFELTVTAVGKED